MIRLAYDEVGAGPPLIILHGLFGSARNWQSPARRLARHYRVICVDQRNHGRSPHTTRFDYADMATDLGGLMDELGLPTASLIGHSMGGKTAMSFALAHPERVTRLVVVDIAPVAYVDVHSPVVAALRALPVSKYSRRQQAEEALAATVTEPDIRSFLLQNLVFGPEGGSWRLNLAAIAESVPALVAALPGCASATFNGPAHVIRGALSDRVSDEYLTEFRRCFPALEVHTVDAAGHWPHAENPAGFLRALLGALALDET
jgi:pimeloyl-ACP methyl ester carboxylesterase